MSRENARDSEIALREKLADRQLASALHRQEREHAAHVQELQAKQLEQLEQLHSFVITAEEKMRTLEKERDEARATAATGAKKKAETESTQAIKPQRSIAEHTMGDVASKTRLDLKVWLAKMVASYEADMLKAIDELDRVTPVAQRAI